MEMKNLLAVKTKAELRAWLRENGGTEKECWVIVGMKPAADTLLYLDAVEQALCFGWIDSTKKKVSETEVAQRLSPRSKKSAWTELNKARVRRLEKLGLMTEEGRRVLPDMRPDAFKIDPLVERRLREDAATYENFARFPTLYRAVRIDTIQSCKKDAELFGKRLEKFVQHTRENKMYGQWHDDGRLLEDSDS
ncbi:YdeI/OmpD-associated family protein [Cohnella rhizosphaerae]|uniref:YdeI/OmpD-associated family protein n=1 Tax=Cohnella rhizosphaerae TaxID=1457232 RepID=A0A9X4KTA3_9BACL|nr:YdeI/OmpD-associated family protein [Cohnella rhizosphaerae]MDG0810497.1 YdeI/OmpD-associated family protein [Cohnella rhizosphaerae]